MPSVWKKQIPTTRRSRPSVFAWMRDVTPAARCLRCGHRCRTAPHSDVCEDCDYVAMQPGEELCGSCEDQVQLEAEQEAEMEDVEDEP